MSNKPLLVAGLITMITASLVAAPIPERVEPEAWAKVELQPEEQGFNFPSKADRDVPIDVAKLLPMPDTIGDDSFFGRTVAMDGDTMVVGANDYGQGGNSGAAFIFQRDDGGTDAWGQVAKLSAPDGADGDYFGSSVSIRGDTVIVGAFGDDDNGWSSGSAYIFDRNHGGSNAWGQVAKLTASDGTDSDHFGKAVSTSGDTVVIGAYGDNDNGGGSGSAYVFGRDHGGSDAWGQVAKLTASDGAYYDSFGSSVSIDDDTVVVGAEDDDNENGWDSGSAYIFGRNQGGIDAWGQVAKLTASDGANNDHFGGSASISGDTVVIGAYGDDDSGSAYIFGRNQGGIDAWGQVAKLTASDGADSDYFGRSVSLSADTVIVGAYGDSENGPYTGAAYIFGRHQGGVNAWGQVAKLTASDGVSYDGFGAEVWISSNTVVVGTPLDDDNGPDSGSAFIFGRDQGGADAWGQVAQLVAPGYPDAQGDQFGSSIAISDDTVVVGAIGDDEFGIDSGAAYIFSRNNGGPGEWGLAAKLNALDATMEDHFGFSVAISGDTVVVGARLDDDNGSDSGSAYIFGRDQGGDGVWGQVAKLTASDGDANDFFGRAVSISGDTVVVGGPGEDDTGMSSGSAYIFEKNQGGTDAWGQVVKLAGCGSQCHFGRSVSLSGDTVVVGTVDFGSAFIFGRNQGGVEAWGQVAKLTALDGSELDNFGESVAIRGDTVVVGASRDDDNGTNSGSAYIFSRNHGGLNAWGQAAKMSASDGTVDDQFGYSVTISGDTAVVGANLGDDCGTDSGSATVFEIARNPEVLTIGTSPDTGDGILDFGEWAGVAITDFSALFSKLMSDPAGDTDPIDVTNPSNWLLVSAGPDGIVQTSSCAVGVTGDDTLMAPDTFVYNDAELTVTFRANGGTALVDGAFTLFACGAMESTGGLQLDGNGDGIGGDDFALSFAIDTVLPTDPTLSSLSHTIGVWSNDDTIEFSWSGATDADAGVGGYSIVTDNSVATEPDAVIDIDHSTDPHGVTEGPLGDGDTRYFHLRTCDVAGNCTVAQHLGPFWIDTTPPTAVADLISTSHVIGVPSADVTIDVEWTSANDTLSGVEGYAVEFSNSANWTCDGVQDVAGTAATSPSLSDNSWWAHVCAVDSGGNWGDVASVGPFVIEAAVPEVRAVGSEGGTNDGLLNQGESAMAAITQLIINFSEPMFNPAGDDTGGDLTNPDHYRVLGLGADGILSTADCTSALGGDDVEVPQGGEPHAWTGDQTVSILALGDLGLHRGRYGLMVCGLEDPAGNEIIGPWIREFSNSSNNLLLDPNFEDDTLSAWTWSGDVLWTDGDPSNQASGVVTFVPGNNGDGDYFKIHQCVDVSEGTPYALGGAWAINSHPPDAVNILTKVIFYQNPGCTDELDTFVKGIGGGNTNGIWESPIYAAVRAPEGARSAQVGFSISVSYWDYFSISIDEVGFFEDTLFVDGFERGTTTWWSGTHP